MSQLSSIVDRFRPTSRNIAAAFDEVERRLVALEKPSPPPRSSTIFGHCKVINHGDLAYCQREFSEMLACGGVCPRIDYWPGGTQSVTIAAARAAGFPQLLLCIGATMYSVPDAAAYAALAVKAASENPGAFLELGNEPGLRWSAADCVRIWNAAYKALRDGGHRNTVLMGSIAGSERPLYSRLGAQQWCRELVAAGFKLGVSADLPNYHLYGDVHKMEAGYINYWTPDAAGSSCQKILGASSFAVTEFGVPLGLVNGDENAAAAGLAEWVKVLDETAGCKLATMYALSDDAGGNSWGYGLCVPAQSWRRRPSFDAFRLQVGA